MNRGAAERGRLTRRGLVSAIMMASTLSMPTSADTLYRWIDADGEVQFSDRQPATDVEFEVINGDSFGPAPPPPPLPGSLRTVETIDVGGGQQDPASDATAGAPAPDPEAIAAEQARVSEHNCMVARKKLESLDTIPRVFRLDENGERVRMTEEERQAGIAEARRNIKKWCRD